MSHKIALFASTAVVLLGAAGANAATISPNSVAYSLGDGGSTLVQVASPSGGGNEVALKDADGAAISLDGIDFRPNTRDLYGYSDATDTYYTVDITSGVVTAVAPATITTSSGALDIDFNPVPDRIRVVNEADQNLRTNPDTGAVTVDGTLAYAVGDVNEGENPSIAFAAYTNSVFGTIATSTQLFVIDFATDTLVLQNPPNDGTLNTVGSLGLDVKNGEGGFDILSMMPGQNAAYALLTDAATGLQGLYEVSLLDGTATLISSVAEYGMLDGLAVAPVPVPAAGLLLLGGLGTMIAIRRRRRAA